MLRRIVAVLMLGSLLLAACGGDDGDGATDGDSDGGDDGGIVGTIDAAECAQVAVAMAAAVQALPQAMTGNAPELGTSVEELQAFAEAAPEEIRADLQTIAEGYASVMQVLDDSGFDPTSGEPPSAEVIAQLTEAAEEVETEDFQAALGRVEAYLQGGCDG